jgi:hypothetical protein
MFVLPCFPKYMHPYRPPVHRTALRTEILVNISYARVSSRTTRGYVLLHVHVHVLGEENGCSACGNCPRGMYVKRGAESDGLERRRKFFRPWIGNVRFSRTCLHRVSRLAMRLTALGNCADAESRVCAVGGENWEVCWARGVVE